MEFAALIENYIADKGFPCTGAKTALSKKLIRHYAAGSLLEAEHDSSILLHVQHFINSYNSDEGPFGTFMILFPETPALTEEQFESALWNRLQSLHELDPAGWDSTVSSNPEDATFSFSLLGKAFYIVGMHPGSSRRARQFPVPALVFNLHEQFEKLRNDGSYGTMRQIIRRRDKVFSGSINPMLQNFGEKSEARQYSGREVSEAWRCPFHAKSH